MILIFLLDECGEKTESECMVSFSPARSGRREGGRARKNKQTAMGKKS